jgi:hypothetical protein
MTSELRTLSQIPARVQYLYAISSTKAWVPSASGNSLVTEAEFPSRFSAITNTPAGTVMRDMGKFLVVVNSDGQHIAHLRLVQTINGALTEGVPNNWNTQGQYYVSVWTANPVPPSPFNVTVARTG